MLVNIPIFFKMDNVKLMDVPIMEQVEHVHYVQFHINLLVDSVKLTIVKNL